MPSKRLEKEEEEQAEAASSEEDLYTLTVKDPRGAEATVASGAATEHMIEDDEAVNKDEEDLDDLEEEEEETAEDAETSGL